MVSECPYCKNRTFKLNAVKPIGSNFTLQFVQCARCHAPFSAVELDNTAAILEQQKKAIADISSQLSRVVATLNTLVASSRR